MLIFGDEKCLRHCIENYLLLHTDTKLFNLSNALERGVGLNNLTPPVYMEDKNDGFKSFDSFYADYIFNNTNSFIDFMKIVYTLYEGKIAYILVSRDDYRDQLSESLLKLIQQRYGYNGYLVNEAEDMESVKESSFSVPGLYNLDQDKERYTLLTITEDDLKRAEKDESIQGV